ncbi:MAG: hypothetical protein HC802_21975 [Caldilineaceae bacterium]|nr:hypothetical protein [Caldilineaceae bacterium]
MAACKKTGKAAGKHCFNPQEVTMRIGQGFQYLALSSDGGLLGQAAREAFSAIDFSGATDQSADTKGSLY